MWQGLNRTVPTVPNKANGLAQKCLNVPHHLPHGVTCHSQDIAFMFSYYGSKQARFCRVLGGLVAWSASAATPICPPKLLCCLTSPPHTAPQTLRASHTICQGAHFNTGFPKGSLSPLVAWILWACMHECDCNHCVIRFLKIRLHESGLEEKTWDSRSQNEPPPPPLPGTREVSMVSQPA